MQRPIRFPMDQRERFPRLITGPRQQMFSKRNPLGKLPGTLPWMIEHDQSVVSGQYEHRTSKFF